MSLARVGQGMVFTSNTVTGGTGDGTASHPCILSVNPSLRAFLDKTKEPSPVWGYYVTTYTRRGELYEHWVYPSGDPAHSRHYSDHGNQKTHPLVPHDHDWHDDGNGNMREDKESQPVNPGFAAPGSKKSNADTALKKTGGIAVGLIIYEGGKWLIAALTAAPTGGGSLAVAALVP